MLFAPMSYISERYYDTCQSAESHAVLQKMLVRLSGCGIVLIVGDKGFVGLYPDLPAPLLAAARFLLCVVEICGATRFEQD